ncbi:MAG: RloB family protein [Bifidobacteriaceae bacterium]|nr:RloB family protein [Bifidobacteriaceae bacterium]
MLAVEGRKTEPQYFQMLGSVVAAVHIKIIKPGASSPAAVPGSMQEYLARADLRRGDEAWIVVDKDQWADDQIDQLQQWAAQSNERGLAVSNPKFEYWLLLHFEDGTGVASSSECSKRLRRHLPGYDKGVECSKFRPDAIAGAVARARARDRRPAGGWPREPGQSTVYRLVERILGS